MPVSFIRLSVGFASTTNQSTAYIGTAGTCLSNDILIAYICTSGNTTSGTMAGGSLTWTLLTSQTKNSGADICSVYWAYAATGVSVTPSYTPSSAATGCTISVVRVAGSTGSAAGPNLQQAVATNTGATTNPTVTFASATLSSNGILVLVSNGTNSTGQFRAPTGFSELEEIAYGSPANCSEVASAVGGQQLLTYAWQNTNNTPWRTFGLEFVELSSACFDPMGMMGFFGI